MGKHPMKGKADPIFHKLNDIKKATSIKKKPGFILPSEFKFHIIDLCYNHVNGYKGKARPGGRTERRLRHSELLIQLLEGMK